MSNQNVQTLAGFRDFLPDDAKKRQWLRGKMIEVFQKWGYEPIETPILEPLSIFQGQIGDDEKLFYRFEDNGGRQVMLRYDQTVPTCRYIGNNFSKLTFPFRRYQIQPNFRAEKPQKGRYREFDQADIDIFGVASPTADAETIAISLDLYRTLGFKKVIAIINSRKLMKDIPYAAISSIDKLKKIGREGVIADMIVKGIAEPLAKSYLEQVESIKPDQSIQVIFDYLKNCGFPQDWYEFTPTLARSFSYSDGPIWEIVVPEYSAGSVGGGERYDALVEKISGQKIPGTGIAFGFDRTLEALETCKLLPNLTDQTQLLVTVFSADLWTESLQAANIVRNAGIITELYPDPEVKFEKQMKYANKKGIPYVVIIGPDELAKNVVILKDMTSGSQFTVANEELANTLKKTLKTKE